MKRRRFIKSVSLSLAGAILPNLHAHSGEKTKTKGSGIQNFHESTEAQFVSIKTSDRSYPQIGIIGLGKTGIETVNRITRRANSTVRISSKDPEHLFNDIAQTDIKFNNIEGQDESLLDSLLNDTLVLFIVTSADAPGIFELSNRVAKLSNQRGILTICSINYPKPASSPGVSQLNLKLLDESADALFLISEGQCYDESTVINTHFLKDPANAVVSALIEMITYEGLICLDFYDFQIVVTHGNRLAFGFGKGHGEKGALKAAKESISEGWQSHISTSDATSVLIHIKAGEDLSLIQAQEAAEYIQNQVSDDADVIFGLFLEENQTDSVEILVVTNQYSDAAEKMRYPNILA